MMLPGASLTDMGVTGPNRRAHGDDGGPPVNAYYLFSEAHLNLKKGNVDRAIENMQQALVLDPDSVYLKRELAGFWLMKKDTTSALKLLDDFDQPSR
jgi:predicted Zn-dependent protease